MLSHMRSGFAILCEHILFTTLAWTLGSCVLHCYHRFTPKIRCVASSSLIFQRTTVLHSEGLSTMGRRVFTVPSFLTEHWAPHGGIELLLGL